MGSETICPRGESWENGKLALDAERLLGNEAKGGLLKVCVISILVYDCCRRKYEFFLACGIFILFLRWPNVDYIPAQSSPWTEKLGAGVYQNEEAIVAYISGSPWGQTRRKVEDLW